LYTICSNCHNIGSQQFGNTISDAATRVKTNVAAIYHNTKTNIMKIVLGSTALLYF